MAKKKTTKRTREEQAAHERRTKEIWERVAEREAIGRAEATKKNA